MRPIRLYRFRMPDLDSSALTPEACRAARALLKWSMRDLAKAAGVSLETVLRVEQGGGIYKPGTLAKLCEAFAMRGVDLVVQPSRSGAILNLAARSDDG